MENQNKQQQEENIIQQQKIIESERKQHVDNKQLIFDQKNQDLQHEGQHQSQLHQSESYSPSQKSQRERSRDKIKYHRQKVNKNEQQKDNSKLRSGQLHYHQYLQKEQEFHTNQQTLRSHLRIQQNRLQPIDMFVKIVYTYKGKYSQNQRDKINSLMLQPKKYLNTLSKQNLLQMIDPAIKLQKAQQRQQIEKTTQANEISYCDYWKNLICLIKYKIQKKQNKVDSNGLNESQVKPEFKTKIKKMLNKPIQQLKKLQAKISLMISNPAFANDVQYWKNIKEKIKGKIYQHNLVVFYENYKNSIKIQQLQEQADDQYQEQQPISPILGPVSLVNSKIITTQSIQKADRLKIAQIIFKQQFQKHRQQLQDNLSLPKNHNLLSKDIVNQSNKTYDFITQQIMEFQKYKRMESDQQQFDEWLPTDTQGRFRDRKPQYINRLRVSYQNSKLQMNKTDAQPVKAIQGYKFNIFYPDLYDKQKTPQYYLQTMQNPDYCLIKFKAGPPYKDVAFKILRKQWDFTQKSGFQSIFAKGILHLYFNFKKPRYRI